MSDKPLVCWRDANNQLVVLVHDCGYVVRVDDVLEISNPTDEGESFPALHQGLQVRIKGIYNWLWKYSGTAEADAEPTEDVLFDGDGDGESPLLYGEVVDPNAVRMMAVGVPDSSAIFGTDFSASWFGCSWQLMGEVS